MERTALKDDIDRGRTRGRAHRFDPAVAPLGTDEEIAGTPIPGEVVAPARWHPNELGHDAAADRQPLVHGARSVFGWPMLVLFVAIAAGVALTFLGH